MSKETDIQKTYSETLYGNYNNKIRFVIDGVLVFENQTMIELIENENEFIKRISNMINEI